MSEDSQGFDDSQEELLDALSSEFLQRWRNGESPEVEAYAAKHPELADEIRELLPAVVFAEQLNPKSKAALKTLSDGLPQQLGPFMLHREVGRGGMGIVYEATQAPFSQKFAVKVLKSRMVKSSTLSTRFAREAQAASRLHHPNIVPARHYGTEGNYDFIVMPMIEGASLDRLINGKEDVDPNLFLLFDEICTDWNRFAELGAQISSALSHAHHNGMIHRDIKPANLILDKEGNIWITDFGLAKLFYEECDLSRTGELIGTPRYMAPEQLVGSADERSDIYGVGLTLYEMLTRGCSWRKPEADGKLPAPVLEKPNIRQFNADVPERLAKTIMKACAHHPDERFQSAREMEIAFNELCYQGKQDRRNSPRSRALASRKQARSVAVLLGVLCVIGLSFGLNPKPIGESPESNGLALRPEHELFVHPPTHCITYQEPGTDLVNVLVSVNDRTDDAEQYGEGIMYLDSSDLELTWDDGEQIVGLRFPGVEIEPGTEIHSAKICVYAERTDQGPSDLKIYGINDANPGPFTPLDYDISNREKTQSFVPWEPARWERSEQYESPECKEIVQQLIDNSDWKSGNAIGFVIEGTGNRTATAYDGNIYYGPVLKIQIKQVESVSIQ